MINTIKPLWSNFKINVMILLFSGILIYCFTNPVYSDGGGWTEDFNADPSLNGWVYTGVSPDLFNWDSSSGFIQSTWNSGTSLSRYGRGIDFGFNLDGSQSFNLQFDISFSSFSVGAYSNYPVAVGLYNSSSTGNRTISFIEWDYYLFGFANYVGVSINGLSGTFSNCSGAFTDNTQAYTLDTVTTYHVNIDYDGASQMLNLTMTADGNPFGSFPSIDLCGVELNLDRLAITNYLDDTPSIFGGPSTHLITGNVDNIQLNFPLSVNSDVWMILE